MLLFRLFLDVNLEYDREAGECALALLELAHFERDDLKIGLLQELY